MKPQCKTLLDYMLVHGSVTGMQSIKLGIMNYKGRIHDLRKMGYTIETRFISKMNRNGEMKTFALYSLKGVGENNC